MVAGNVYQPHHDLADRNILSSMTEKYIVLGHGRTGTHWVCDLMQAVSSEPLVMLEDDVSSWLNTPSAILHTNHIPLVMEVPRDRRCDVTVIVCRRLDAFATLISLYVADYTNEWSGYSDKKYEPFEIDVRVIPGMLSNYYNYYNQWVAKDIRGEFDHVVDVIYEDLWSADSRERYICDLLSVPYSPDRRLQKNQLNPRRYQEIISNYDQLRECYDRFLDEHPDPWKTS